ncbi:MAG: pyridoxal 5'-phosphate synthase glutaminase subunit PdxT [Nitrosopumilaceae archaeon]|nr:pyridoxal 5'-phosphate synthase glutaminase subunit PdxT [Nitrosopumilaceae archaeon]NIU02328.1 pyridoxal 5'-phosphate synthase glutaminase subunit PdxT [Nitrosopumilaceae archaeon]NIU88783.1 pyridoxal 5'-phosphate synthase glutaminase subunit PdxT [Nitrosopumilaceae archaeon]NIV66910.1 pyridoxal 5'-phosphate synthase glutaminase subunit PdxT [Nitrosopumilaceae archaeon]NIX62929.1 pyridoxal 5'-phosphate synthase glutaminase subunit PdxT [Nitrosopumilaceae archaeon]
MTRLDIGVLAVQGDVAENVRATQQALKELGVEGTVHAVKTPLQMANVDGLIIPGGESTTIGQLSLVNSSMKQMKEKIESGMPVLGICAGMILLSNTADDRVVGRTEQPLLGLLDIKLERNSFGRQRESFEADVSLEQIQIPKFRGVFIRAPSVSSIGSGIEVLSKLNEKIVAIKKGNIIGTSFHPELTDDVSVHKQFVKMVEQTKNN